MAEGPLAGVRILDLTHVWAGPLATRILADLGATVVKVESPMGRGPQKPPEGTTPFVGGDAGADPWNRHSVFVKLNRNKGSIALDLKKRDARLAFLELVGQADVVIENFSARTMPGLGLDYAALRAANARIIYVAMPGYGANGPYSDWVAFGPSVEPMTGLDAILGYAPSEPRNTGMALTDAIAGVSAAAAVVTALNRRRTTREGARVELSLHEAGVSFWGDVLLERQLGGDPQPMGNAHPAHPFSAVLPTRGDDQWIAVTCRTATERALFESIAAAGTTTFDKHDLARQLQAAGIAAGPVNVTADFLADPQLAARQFFVHLGREGQVSTPYPGTPVVVDGTTHQDRWTTAPLLGEHNREVLATWLGYDDARIDALVRDGALVDRPPG